jgi:hypothetical protein
MVMSLLAALLRKKQPEPPFSPDPEVTHEMPTRPYRVLHADLPFYSDPQCQVEVKDARLVVLLSEDPRQKHHPIECMPTRKRYQADQILRWDINHKRQWDEAWYVNPDTKQTEKAWTRAVEFLGVLVKLEAD